MVQSHVQVDDVAIEEDPLIRDTMADYLVDRRADRFGEVVVVERRRVRLDVMLGDGSERMLFAAESGELTFRSIQALCTISSISSVVMPGLRAAAAMSKTSLASLQTFRIFSCAVASRMSILFARRERPALGMPSAA